jgi:cobalamin biosynthesis protein CobD/CbiB
VRTTTVGRGFEEFKYTSVFNFTPSRIVTFTVVAAGKKISKKYKYKKRRKIIFKKNKTFTRINPCQAEQNYARKIV